MKDRNNSILIWDSKNGSVKWKKLIDDKAQLREDRKQKLDKINALQPILRKFN